MNENTACYFMNAEDPRKMFLNPISLKFILLALVAMLILSPLLFL